jgi:hypothetical protein
MVLGDPTSARPSTSRVGGWFVINFETVLIAATRLV